MRVFWTILAIAGGLVLLVLVGVAIAVWTVDVNQFVAPVQQKVKEATGRDLRVGGGVKLSLGLEPKLVLGDVHLSNAPWAKAREFVTVKRAEVDVALLPLLQRRFELVRLTLVDPVIALESDAHGVGNWQFGTAAGAPAVASAAGAASVMSKFGIASFEIENGSLTYLDGVTGATTEVAIDRFVAQARTPASPLNAEFKGRVDNVPIALSGNLGPLEALIQRRSPYAISVEGKVANQPASASTKMRFVEGGTQLEDLVVGLAGSKVTGSAVIVSAGTRPMITVRLSSPALSMADLRLLPGAAAAAVSSAKSTKAAPSTSTGKDGYLFSDEPVSFAALSRVDADVDVTIGTLTLDDGRRLAEVRARFTIKDGRLDAPELRAKMYGGTLDASLKIDATHAPDPAIALIANGAGLDLGALLAATGTSREIRGGKTDVAIDIATHGATPREWARGADGTVQIVVGPATIVNAKLDPASPLNQLAQAVNPLRNVNPSTELVCAVIRLPLHQGIAKVDRSIAAQTRDLGVSASGTLDFRTETLDLSLAPRARIALPAAVPQLAELVRFRGPFASPTVAIDAKGSAVALARVGAAVGTSGLSVVGESLVSSAPGGSGDPCDMALGRAPQGASSGAPASGPMAVPAEIGKALSRLLGH